jgi:hypothetical protein
VIIEGCSLHEQLRFQEANLKFSETKENQSLSNAMESKA